MIGSLNIYRSRAFSCGSRLGLEKGRASWQAGWGGGGGGGGVGGGGGGQGCTEWPYLADTMVKDQC